MSGIENIMIQEGKKSLIKCKANVCYGPNDRAPDYENKKGTIIGYERSPLVLRLKECVEILMKDKDLIVEGNQYDDPKKNGIGPMVIQSGYV